MIRWIFLEFVVNTKEITSLYVQRRPTLYLVTSMYMFLIQQSFVHTKINEPLELADKHSEIFKRR